MAVVVDGAIAGLVSVADPVKATTPEALDALHAVGFRIVMVTGDSAAHRRAVAARLGHRRGARRGAARGQGAHRPRPAGGRGAGGDGRRRHQRRAGAGAGRRRHRHGHRHRRRDRERRGHAGEGRPARHRPRAQARLATMRNIRQNLFFALAYNAAGVPMAAGVLYPAFGLLLSPMVAAAAMSLSLGVGDRQFAQAARAEARRLRKRMNAGIDQPEIRRISGSGRAAASRGRDRSNATSST